METLTKKDTTYKKFTYHRWANKKFQKIFKDFNITLVPTNKYNIKNLINADHKDKNHHLKNQEFTKLNVNSVKKCTLGRQREIEKQEKNNILMFEPYRKISHSITFLEHRT